MTEKNEDDENSPDYKVSKKVAVGDLLKMDTEDESLRKYKEALLGKAAKEVYAPKDDPRRVVLMEMRVTCEGRKDDIVFKCDTDQDVKKMKDTPFVLKEGCNYKISLSFRVQHEIVTGLKYVNLVYRKGIRVDKGELMVGSFPPQKDPHKMTFPKNGWDEAPKGLVSRGSYKAKSQLIDDDKQCHLEFEYAFDIKKDWTSDD